MPVQEQLGKDSELFDHKIRNLREIDDSIRMEMRKPWGIDASIVNGFSIMIIRDGNVIFGVWVILAR